MIDKSKQYRTKDGRKVHILSIDDDGLYPVNVAVFEDGRWKLTNYCRDGRGYPGCNTPYDLIEVKPRIKRDVWVNVYPVGTDTYGTRQSADENAMDTRIACVRLTFDCEEGEGL